MKKYINAFLSLAAVATLSLASCSRENPFDDYDGMTGGFRTASLNMSVNMEENVVRALADDAPGLETFTVSFMREGESEPKISYKYTELPEIVTLPVGNYTAVATSGKEQDAVWDTPFYRGESESFVIASDAVTEVSEPVVCRLSNVKVSVYFDSDLTAAMSPDSKVTVRVSDQNSLEFTKKDEGRHGYFSYVENNRSLTAHFEGTVEDYPTAVTKSRDDVHPGNHYIITFSLRSAGEEEPGDVSPALEVDATVTVKDESGNVIVDDVVLEDDMRPSQGGDDPNPPSGDDPQPPVGGNGPEVKATDDSSVSLDKVNDFYDGVVCKLLITSSAPEGISAFAVDIKSPTLTKDVLEDVGLSDHLDLINPGEMMEALEGLGFPVGNQVKGQKEVTFNISGFGGLLGMLGAGEHEFKLTITDSDGTTVKTLRLRTL